MENGYLKYQWLGEFDRDMIKLAKGNDLFRQQMADLMFLDESRKLLAFYRHGLLFAFNFNPSESYTNVLIPVHTNADYTLKLSSDDEQYGGQNLVEHMKYTVKKFDDRYFVELYLPARTAVVLKEGRVKKEK